MPQHRLDRDQDVRPAAKVFDQFHEPLPAAHHGVAIFAEHARLRVPKAIDRLIDIADGVEPVGRSQQLQQPCLTAVGVLELVHEHLVELCLHAPLHVGAFFEQTHGVLFEIVIIQAAGLLFALAV